MEHFKCLIQPGLWWCAEAAASMLVGNEARAIASWKKRASVRSHRMSLESLDEFVRVRLVQVIEIKVIEITETRLKAT